MISELPDQSVLGKLVSPSTSDAAFEPTESWSKKKCELWFDQTMRTFSKQHRHDLFSKFSPVECTIVPARQVAAGIKLESGTVVMTDSYLDYLELISHHASIMQLIVQMSNGSKTGQSIQTLSLIRQAETTVPELFTWLACNHLSGNINCGELLSQLSVGNFEEEIRARSANWVVYTLLHELGHLDIFHRGINVESQKEEFYCDAFALKGWHDDKLLLRFTRDIVLLFTYQWPIDLRLRVSRTHPPTFERARMILDGMNVNGAFDDLIGSMSEFWRVARATATLPYDVRKDAVASVSDQDVAQKSLEYVSVINELIKLANTVEIGGRTDTYGLQSEA